MNLCGTWKKVSTGLITLSQRLRGVDENEDVIDGLAPKLQSIFKEIANVDIQDQNGNLRSTYDILQDLAGAWDTLTSKQKQYIGEKSAGIRQISVFNSIIDNFRSVQKATADAANSTGSALKENEKFLDSIQGKRTSWRHLSKCFPKNTINSGLIKFIIDFANALVTLIDKIGVLPTLLTGLTIFTSFFAGNKFSGIIKGLTSGLASIPAKIKAIGTATFTAIGPSGKHFTKFGESVSKAGVSMSKLQVGVLAVTAIYSIGKTILDGYTNGLVEQERKAKELSDTWKTTRESLVSNKKCH